jgi:hypothetical protein
VERVYSFLDGEQQLFQFQFCCLLNFRIFTFLTILGAWELWFQSRLPDDTVLWGLTILSWGRLGKVAEFFGAALIVADIIGPEKLRSWGHELHQFASLSFARKTLLDAWTFARAFVGEGTRTVADCVDVLSRYKTGIIAAVSGYLLVALGLYEIWLENLPWWQYALAAFILIFMMFAISPLLAIVAVFTIGLFGLVIDKLIITPLARALTQPAPDRAIKILSFLLLIAGFHFDLLAS